MGAAEQDARCLRLFCWITGVPPTARGAPGQQAPGPPQGRALAKEVLERRSGVKEGIGEALAREAA